MQLKVDFFQFKSLLSVSDDEMTTTQHKIQILRNDLWNINNML